MALSKYLRRPGERVQLLAFDNNLTTVRILQGWVKDGQLLQDKTIKNAIEANEMIPLVQKDKKGRTSLLYPVDLETSQGIRFQKTNDLVLTYINPGLIGNAIDSDIIKKALALKPEVWQIAVAGLICLILGAMIGAST